MGRGLELLGRVLLRLTWSPGTVAVQYHRRQAPCFSESDPRYPLLLVPRSRPTCEQLQRQEHVPETLSNAVLRIVGHVFSPSARERCATLVPTAAAAAPF